MYGAGQFVSDAEVYQAVSFVVPAHNEAAYLKPTLTAISSAIETLKLDAEIVVVNDASTDQTRQIAIDAGANVVDVELRNIGAVRNAGAAAAQNPWLIFVDADTIVPAETIAASLDRLVAGHRGGGAWVEIPHPEEIYFLKRWMYYGVVLVWQVAGRWAAGCYMFCSKESFDSFGGFNENYFAAEEYFFSTQLKRLGRFSLVRPPVITSARKLHRYSSWQLMRFLLVPLMSLGSVFQSKRGLELLYEDSR